MIFSLLFFTIFNYSLSYENLSLSSFLQNKLIGVEDKNSLLDFKESIESMSSIQGLFKLDSTLLSRSLYSKSDFVEGRLLKVIRGDNGFTHSTLSGKYLKQGLKDLKANKIESGQRELKFALDLDPSNRIVPLILLKYNIRDWRRVCEGLKGYFSTYRFFDNKVTLLINFMFFLIIFFALVYIALVILGLVRSVPFISEWVRVKMGINGLSVPALLFCLFVWLPILPFLAILTGISLMKMSRGVLIRLAFLSVILPLTTIYTYKVRLNADLDGPIYNSFKARYDPYNYGIDEPRSPYGYTVKGIEMGRNGELSRAELLFQKGYENKKSLIFLTNLSSVYFSKGQYEEALSLCKKIISMEPHNPIANLTMANIYLDQLDFEKASMYLDIAAKSGPEFTDRVPPVYQYPPDGWLFGSIVRVSGIIQYIKEGRVYYFFILAVFLLLLVFSRRSKDEFCPICGRIIIRGIKIEGEIICDICVKELSLTKSKSIRERLKRRIVKKSHRTARFGNFVMNMILPGSAHLYRKRWLTGVWLLFVTSLLLTIYIGPFYSLAGSTIQYRAFIGNNIYIFSLIFYYFIMLILTWRLTSYGNGR
jgi:tetratricopeptide (TPR) repeat protein